MRPKAVLDTNAFVSALNFGGNPDLILRLSRGRTKRFDLFLSPFILKELAETLSSKLFWSYPKIEKTTKLLVSWGDVVSTRKSISAIPSDETDNRILECAAKAKADFIVSGDKHLLGLKKYEGVRIVTPAQFLRILEKIGGQN